MSVHNKALTGIGCAGVVGVVLYQLLAAHQSIFWLSVVFLGILMFICESLEENLHTCGSSTYGMIVLFASMLALNTLCSVLVALVGAFSYQDWKIRKSPWVLVFNACQYALAISTGSFFYHLLGGASQSFRVRDVAGSILPLLVAALFFWLVNSLLVSAASFWEYGIKPADFYRQDALKLLPNQIIYAYVGLGLGVVYAQNAFHLSTEGVLGGSTAESIRGFFSAALLLLLLGVAWYFSGKNIELLDTYDRSVTRLVQFLEQREPYLVGHGERVARYALLVASKLKMSPIDQEKLKYAALLHDLGKAVVPREVLLQKGDLSEEEFEKVKQHPLIGGAWLEEIPYLSEAASAVYHHHEYYDGGGYVDMIAGDTIPLNARIIAIADAYDAMLHPRPWREAKSPEMVAAELLENSDIQFDRGLVRVFLEALGEAEAEAEAVFLEKEAEIEGEERIREAEPMREDKFRERVRAGRLGRRRRNILEERRRLREEQEARDRRLLLGEGEAEEGPPSLESEGGEPKDLDIGPEEGGEG
jgi:HD-GYP domain-containing protein (c-di-GMP phosphodiesterase class II)